MNQIVVHFQLTRSEAVGAMRRLMFRTRQIWLIIAGGLVLIGSAGLLQDQFNQSDRADSSGTVQLLLILGIVYLLLLLSVFTAPGRSWEKNASVRGPQSVAFSDYGIQQRSLYSEGASQWVLYSQTFKTAECYLLRMPLRRATLVMPKRAFASVSDELAFRVLAERYTVARLRPSGSGLPPGQVWSPPH